MLGLIERFESETVVTQIKQENLIFIVVPRRRGRGLVKSKKRFSKINSNF